MLAACSLFIHNSFLTLENSNKTKNYIYIFLNNFISNAICCLSFSCQYQDNKSQKYQCLISEPYDVGKLNNLLKSNSTIKPSYFIIK